METNIKDENLLIENENNKINNIISDNIEDNKKEIHPSITNKININEQKSIFFEKINKFETRIAQNPWDTEAWTSIIMEAQNKDISIVRDIYERFLKQFPTAGRFWKLYAEHEMAAKNYDNVAKIFSRCLLYVPNIDLWKSYLNFVQLTKTSREEMIKAYEFALEYMSMDIFSTVIWKDYINFIKEVKPKNQYEEGQQINLLRKLYQRAIRNPMNNLEDIWKEYDAYENELNKLLAKSLLNEQSPTYMKVRATSRERKRYYEPILRNMLARPPLISIEDKEEQQVIFWKKLLNYEKSNPQCLDKQGLVKRVIFTYNQCLLCLYHYPEMWYDFASYVQEMCGIDEAVKIYERALEAIPGNLLLNFSYADMHELHKNIQAAKDIYERLLKIRQDTLIWIQYLKFTRRNEGIKETRIIFKRARNCPNITYHLYIASALIEWEINKEVEVARKIFDWGISHKFGDEPAFMIEYLKFLFHLNEENNIRALFEKAITLIPKEKATEIWNMYLEFEKSYGDLNTITKLENRKSILYPESDPPGILTLVHRYQYQNLLPCSDKELSSFGSVVINNEEENKISEQKDLKSSFELLTAHHNNPNRLRFPRPDLTQVIPFRPDTPITGQDLTPEALTQFILNLPNPNSWQGPIIDIDQLIQITLDTSLPPPPVDSQLLKKRKEIEEDDDDEQELIINPTNPPPPHDLFRQRQALKLLKKKIK